MRYHDYRLRGYALSNFGETVILDLVSNYSGQPVEESRIEFRGVVLHHFVHTAGAIIMDIFTVPLPDLFAEFGDAITEWNRRQGVDGWTGTIEDYAMTLEGMSCWRILSAVGFNGFVIGREVHGKVTV